MNISGRRNSTARKQVTSDSLCVFVFLCLCELLNQSQFPTTPFSPPVLSLPNVPHTNPCCSYPTQNTYCYTSCTTGYCLYLKPGIKSPQTHERNSNSCLLDFLALPSCNHHYILKDSFSALFFSHKVCLFILTQTGEEANKRNA